MTPDEAHARIAALGFSAAHTEVLFDHFHAAESRGKLGHGFVRINWLESQTLNLAAQPRKIAESEGLDRWDGDGAVGYLTMAAICADLIAQPVAGARLVVASPCSPTGMLGYWVRLLADAGYVALLTGTSPRRLPHPRGGPPLTGTNPLAIGIPSSDNEPIVTDVSMGAVTHGDVLTGKAKPEELVPFGGPLAHKAFALAVGIELFVAALAGPAYGAVLLVAGPSYDPVPAFRELAAGVRLPGTSAA